MAGKYNQSFPGKSRSWTCDFQFPCGKLKVKSRKPTESTKDHSKTLMQQRPSLRKRKESTLFNVKYVGQCICSLCILLLSKHVRRK